MKKRVYLETTILSYLAARPPKDPVLLVKQRITLDWWSGMRGGFDLFISETVMEEISAGDSSASSRRLALVKGIPILDLNPEIASVAKRLLKSGLLPGTADRDAVHIASASIHGMNILLTWNCRHIANGAIMEELRDIIDRQGHKMPILCTPLELMEAE